MRGSGDAVALERFRSQELVRHLLKDQHDICLILARGSDNGVKVLEEIESQERPKWFTNGKVRDYWLFQWGATAVKLRASTEPRKLADNRDLSLLKNEAIYVMFTGEEQMFNESVANHLVSSLRQMNAAKLVSLLPHIRQACVKRMNVRSLVVSFGSFLFRILPVIGYSDIRDFPINEIKRQDDDVPGGDMNVNAVLSDLCLVEDEEVPSNIQQALWVTDALRPREKSLFQPKSRKMFGLTNSVIAYKKHFTAVLLEEGMRTLIRRENVTPAKLVPARIKNADKLRLCMFLLVVEDIYCDEQNFNASLQECQSIKLNDAVSDFFRRANNDKNLLSFIRGTSNLRCSLSDVVEESIPKIFERSEMMDYVPCNELEKACDGSNGGFYCFGDDDLANDLFFTYRFKAMYEIIKYILGYVNGMEKAEDPLDCMCRFINSRRDHNTDEEMADWLKDVMSLLFLEKSGEYLCDLDRAYHVVTKLMDKAELFTVDALDYYRSAVDHIAIARSKEGANLQSALFGRGKVVHTFLEKDDFIGADEAARGDQNLETLVYVVENRRRSKDDSTVGISGQTGERHGNLNMEDVLCGLRGNAPAVVDDQVRGKKKFGTPGPSRKIAGRRRSGRVFSQGDLFADDDTLSSHSSLGRAYGDAMKCYTYVIDSRGARCDPLSILQNRGGELRDTGRWKEFRDYQRICDEVRNSVVDGESLSPGEIVEKMIERVVNADEDSRRRLLGIHGIEFILSCVRSFSDKLSSIIRGMSEVTWVAISCLNASNTEKLPIDTACGRYVGQEKVNDLVELDVDEFTLLVQSELRAVPFPEESLNDLYMRDMDRFNEILMKHIGMISVKDAMLLDALMHMRSLPQLHALEIETLNFEDVLGALVDGSHWLVLWTFVKDFDCDIGCLRPRIIERRDEIEVECPTLLERLNIGPAPKTPVRSLTAKATDLTGVYAECNCLGSLLRKLQHTKIEPYMGDAVIEATIRVLNGLNINSVTHENDAIEKLPKIAKIISRVPSSQFTQKLNTIVSMVKLSLVTRFGVTLNLKGFLTDVFGYEMARRAFKYDHWQIMIDFCSAWSIGLSNLIIESTIDPFNMGLISVGESIMKRVTPSRDLALDCLIDTLSRSFLFDLSQAAEGGWTPELLAEVAPLHERWKYIDEHGLCLELGAGLTVGSVQIKALVDILERMGEKGRLAVFHCIHRDIESAISVWHTLTGHSYKMNMFIRGIIYTVIAFETWTTFWKKIRHRAIIERTVEAIASLLAFLEQKKMYRALYDVQMKMEMYEKAYASAVELIEIADTWSERKQVCEFLKVSSERFGGGKKIRMAKIEVQTSIVDLFSRRGDDPHDIPAVLDRWKSATSVGAKLLELGEIKLFESLFSYGLLINEACKLFVRHESDHGGILELFKRMSICDDHTYEALAMSLITALRERGDSDVALKALVDKGVIPTFKARIYYVCGFFEEALVFAKRTRDVALVEIIEERLRKQ